MDWLRTSTKCCKKKKKNQINMEELEIQDTWWLGQNWGCEVPRGVWVWIVNTLEVPRHLTSCWSCEFSFFLFLNKPSSMEWLQREHKLAYHFENTAKCPGRGDEKGSEAIFSCKGIGKLSLLWKCFFFFLQEFRTAFEPLSKCSTE